MSAVQRVMNGEKWRVITPILLVCMTAISTLGIKMIEDTQKDIAALSVKIDKFTSDLHRVEIRTASIEGNRFTSKDGFELKSQLALLEQKMSMLSQ